MNHIDFIESLTLESTYLDLHYFSQQTEPIITKVRHTIRDFTTLANNWFVNVVHPLCQQPYKYPFIILWKNFYFEINFMGVAIVV